MKGILLLIGLCMVLVGCSYIDKYDEPFDVTSRLDSLILKVNETLEVNYDLGYVQGFVDCQNNNTTKVIQLKEKYGKLQSEVPQ